MKKLLSMDYKSTSKLFKELGTEMDNKNIIVIPKD